MNLFGKVFSLLLLGFIRLYRYTLSAFMGRTCRYLPTCSEYAQEAIGRHGAWAGFWLGIKRILRCNPWGGHGFDPVPEKLDYRGIKFWKYGRVRAKHTSK